MMVRHDSLDEWLAAIARPAATPAGGAAAALSAALAAALVEMVAGMTAERERYAPVHQRVRAVRARAATLREELLGLARRDADVFADFERALALPRATEDERSARQAAKLEALSEGARVQLEVLERAGEIAGLAADLADEGLASAVGDSAAAGFLAAGAARSAYWAVKSNLQDPGAKPGDAELTARGLELLAGAEAAENRARRILGERVG